MNQILKNHAKTPSWRKNNHFPHLFGANFDSFAFFITCIEMKDQIVAREETTPYLDNIRVVYFTTATIFLTIQTILLMKGPALLLLFLMLTLGAFAQEVVATQGDSYTDANGSLDFTIGEVVIATGTDGTNAITQGFQQPILSLVGVEDHLPTYEASIFPNPTADRLFIRASLFQGVSYQLFDARGRVVMQASLSAAESSLEVSQLALGTYLLTLIDEDQSRLKTFKLVKH
jgi:hypothetical protein